LYEGIVAGVLDFDYAPASACIENRRVWMNVSQEGKSDIEFLREEELVNGLQMSSKSFQPLTCYQISEKGKELVNLPVASNISQFFSFFTFPNFSYLTNFEVWKAALTLAIVASLETLLGIEAVDKLDPLKRVTPTNLELKAQGVGNIVSGMIGGLPLTSVIVRGSANVAAGAKSKVSAILHGVLLLLFVLLIPTLINKIPLASLAAILVFTGYKLAKISLFKEFYQKGLDQFIPFVATIIAILMTDLLIGI
jgi:MFS superfamily sulfate permease-like transporter